MPPVIAGDVVGTARVSVSSAIGTEVDLAAVAEDRDGAGIVGLAGEVDAIGDNGEGCGEVRVISEISGVPVGTATAAVATSRSAAGSCDRCPLPAMPPTSAPTATLATSASATTISVVRVIQSLLRVPGRRPAPVNCATCYDGLAGKPPGTALSLRRGLILPDTVATIAGRYQGRAARLAAPPPSVTRLIPTHAPRAAARELRRSQRSFG